MLLSTNFVPIVNLLLTSYIFLIRGDMEEREPRERESDEEQIKTEKRKRGREEHERGGRGRGGRRGRRARGRAQNSGITHNFNYYGY